MANNQGIMHLANAPGQKPYCGRRDAHMSTTTDRAVSWDRICVRCMNRLSDKSREDFEASRLLYAEAVA